MSGIDADVDVGAGGVAEDWLVRHISAIGGLVARTPGSRETGPVVLATGPPNNLW